MCDGLASILGGGEVGGLLGRRVDGGLLGGLASWRVGWFVGGQTGRSLVGKEGGGSLAGHHSVIVIIIVGDGVKRIVIVSLYCTSGMFLMTIGAVILFDVVATLRGGAFATLGLGAATLRAGGGGAFAIL